jgi:hypothetical protein
MLLIESGLMLIALLLAFVAPGLGSSLFVPLERRLAWLARRRGLAVLTVGATALALRAAVLPILPIPYPVFQDEFSYLLMGDTFAHGRLTNPTHPLWVHFETITVIHRPTYCSVFYPAQGLFLALGQVVFRHPFWGVWLSAGIMCAVICWMLQAWVHPFWALIGGLLAAIRLGTFSYWANSYWGGTVAAIGGALILGALPRIRREKGVKSASLMGIGFAILACSRPYEGFFFSIPVFVAVLLWIWRERKRYRQLLIRVLVPVAVILSLTAGFLLYYFWRTTGNPLLPPYIVNLRTYFVDPGFPWLPLRPTPDYHHDLLRNYYLGWNLGQFEFARAHPFFAATIKVVMLWFFFLGPLLSLPFLALGFALPYGTSFKDLRPKIRFLLIVCAATLVGLLLPAYANPHYAAPLTAVIYALVAMALERVRRWHIGQKPTGIFLVRAVGGGVVILLFLRAAIPLFHLHITNSAAPMTWCSPWTQIYPRSQIESRLDTLPGKHLVLVHYGPEHDASASWVNNSADIDHSRIVWAHDMGREKNAELLRYFSDRDVWWLDPRQTDVQLTRYTAPNRSGAPEVSDKSQAGQLDLPRNTEAP